MEKYRPEKSVLEIRQSPKDKMMLAGLSGNKNIQAGEQPATYKGCVVLKPWGYEFLVFKNAHVAIWLLCIKRSHSTSMHCHPGKSTSLILLSGKALCNTFTRRSFLEAGDAVVIDKGVFHSTKALSLDDIFVLEIESPPNKTDLLRLHDNYGRENYCYECVSQMVCEDLARFGHFYVDKSAVGKEHMAVKNKASIILHETGGAGSKSFKPNPSSLYSLCEGSSTAKIQVGGVIYGRELERPTSSGKFLLMEMKLL